MRIRYQRKKLIEYFNKKRDIALEEADKNKHIYQTLASTDERGWVAHRKALDAFERAETYIHIIFDIHNNKLDYIFEE